MMRKTLAHALQSVCRAISASSPCVRTIATASEAPMSSISLASATRLHHPPTMFSATAIIARTLHTTRTMFHPESSTSAAAEAQRILRTLSNTEFHNMIKAEAENHTDLSYEEWATFCRNAGVAHSDEEVASTLRSFSDAGVVLHFQNRVYLQPKEIAETILSALRADFPAAGDSSVHRLAQQLQELEEKKDVVVTQAQRRASWWLWGLAGAMVTQFSVFFYLTFVLEEEYGWDIVEPMTFFAFYSFGLCSYLYFLLTRQEFTWERLHDRLFKRELQKLSGDVDLAEYEHLAKKLRRHRHLLMRAAGKM